MSGVFPLGGPHQGGTGITLVGGGFPALREMAWSCKIGPVGPTPATLDATGALRCVVPPTRQPEQIFDTRLRPRPTPGEVSIRSRGKYVVSTW